MRRCFFKVLLGLLAFAAVERFCHFQTDGFRYYEVLTNLPNDPSWEAPPLAEDEQRDITSILNQPFFYLGSGGQCYAFCSSDGKYVLKLFRHSHLSPENLLGAFQLPVGDKFRNDLYWKLTRHPQKLFPSFLLAYEKAKEETGLVYLHLNKTCRQFKKIQLIDKGHVLHTLDLDATEFALQKKAEPLFPYLEKKIQQRQAKEALSALFACIANCSKKGIKDNDGAIRRNFGFLDGKAAAKAIAFDIGSFVNDDSLKEAPLLQKELEEKTYRVKKWLRKHHPDLLPLYEEEKEKAALLVYRE